MIRTALLFTGTGPVLIATSHHSIGDPQLLKHLHEHGIDKFVGYEVPVEIVKNSYGEHFHTVMHDGRESDGLRIIDDDGERVFSRVQLADFGPAVMHEGS
jgi:hypothetical protein